jgi:hypothetical protein
VVSVTPSSLTASEMLYALIASAIGSLRPLLWT